MATRSRLSVLIGGDDRQLQTALRRSRKSMSRFGKEIRSSVNTVAKLGIAAAAAGAAIAAHLVNSSLQAIDAQAKLAAQLKTTVASMATLERVAELTGIPMKKIGILSKALEVRVSEAAVGTGLAVDVFRRLKITAEDLAALPLDQRLALVNTRMRELIPSTERAALAAKIFGVNNAATFNLLDSDTIAQAARDAELFGQSLSEIDAAQVELANDAMSRVTFAAQGLTKQIAVRFAPLLDQIAKKLTGMAEQAGGFDKVAGRAFNNVIDASGFVLDAVDGVRRAFILTANAIIVAFSTIIAVQTKNLSRLFAVLEKLPGFFIANLLDVKEKLNAFSKQSAAVVELAVDKMKKTLLEPLPSDGLKKWVAKAEEAGAAAAAAAVKAKEARNAAATDIIQTGAAEEKEQAAFEKRVEAIQGRYLTEQELLRAHQLVMDDIMRAHREGRFATDEEFQALVEEANRQHMTRLTQIRARGLTDIEKFNRASWQSQAKTLSSMLVQMTGAVANQNKQMFEINKVAGISNALLSAKESILNAYAFGSKALGPVGGAAMAAIAAAATFAQVNAIRGTTFGGGGGAVAPSLAGGTAAPPVTPVQSSGGQSGGERGGPTTIINLEGDVFGRDQVRNLIEKINEETKDGGRILLT